MVDVAKLIGVVKILDEPMTFALPVFAFSGEGDYVMQDIDETGLIARFTEIDTSDLEVFPITSGVKRRIGEAAIYAFEAEPECFNIDEKGALTPIVQSALGRPQLKDRPFTRSDIAAFCGDLTTVESADIQATQSLPDGATKQYFRINILARDKIKGVFAEKYNSEYLAPTFRIDEDLHGLTVVLEAGANSNDLKRMRVVVGGCCSDLARLLHRNLRNWRCKVVLADARVSSGSDDANVATRARDGSMIFEGVWLTHPDRVLYPEEALTKLDLARYYQAVADRALPNLVHRPLTLVRCPDGQRLFYQKHLGKRAPEAIGHVDITEDAETVAYPVIQDLAGLIGLVQMNVIELHPSGADADKLDTPDRITFDLDPDASLAWERVTEAAVDIREALRAIGLESFAKTTGGKGLHVVVPLQPRLGWDEVKAFTKWVADQFVAQSPDRFTASMNKRARRGRIYIDYLRNSRGATAIGAYSPRARRGAMVSTPLFWEEVEKSVGPEGFTVATVPQRLAALDRDPWGEIGKLRQSISAAVRRQVGA